MIGTTAADVLGFWFAELEPRQWWVKDEQVDAKIAVRFAQLHRDAAAAKLYHWREDAAGRLAEIIILDQFSRNLFRNSAQAFAYDGMALILAQEAIRLGADREFDPVERSFFYMPYMHSESMAIHSQAVKLFDQQGLEFSLEFELKHKAIIDRFGRYPHRNAALGRISTAEERAFLQQPGSSF